MCQPKLGSRRIDLHAGVVPGEEPVPSGRMVIVHEVEDCEGSLDGVRKRH